MKTPALVSTIVLALAASACSDPSQTTPEPAWSQVEQSADAALLSVHGTAADDVWMVGADDGAGPLILHWDGNAWERRDSGVRGDLWWVHAVKDGAVFFGGSDAHLLRYEDGRFERLPTPGLGKHIVFGVWAASPTDVYAVGSVAGRNGFIWHFDGQVFRELAVPDDLPMDEFRDVPGFFKVWGTSSEDVWVVGGKGVVLHGNAAQGFRLRSSDEENTFFTVHAAKDQVVIVGGAGGGMLLESSGEQFREHTPEDAPLLQGACVADDGTVWATGLGGSIYRDEGRGFEAVDAGIDFEATQSLHATWVDPDGGVWAVGGNVLTPELDAGIAVHRGPLVPAEVIAPRMAPEPACPASGVDPAPEASIARRWSEQILGAIRRDVPRPTVHARNLFHLSVALWDAWAAYDEVADGYASSERLDAEDVDAAREEAISYAAYRVLTHRYGGAVGGPVSKTCFDAFMQKLGYDPADRVDTGDSPRALGNRIGAAVIAKFAEDGANEAGKYAAAEAYESDVPLSVEVPGTRTTDPLHWQPLVLAEAVTQNGIPLGAGQQDYIGAHWAGVAPFALERPAARAAYLDIGTPPVSLDADLVDAAVEVLERSSELDADDGVLIDISPGAYGNNPLGTNDGSGYTLNPATSEPYAPQRVKRGDFARVLAEFWADGPLSETPPGHWNTVANHAAEHPAFARRLFGESEPLDALAWDVHLYLAMNGALHDAAIAAWELKRIYTTARPITLIRYMGARGQRSDPGGPAYDPEGLPLREGLIEVITEASSAPGERHAHLARYVGQIAVRAWRGEPGDRRTEVGGVGWIRALDWMPYQRRTFVTPAFPGYVSGHSTFSRSAAYVLSTLTGSEYFPGGLGSYTFDPGYLFFERGPSEPIRLEWATYYDAADQAGQSRVWGGIHVRPDDLDGRRIGARVGEAAVERARAYFDGSALP